MINNDVQHIVFDVHNVLFEPIYYKIIITLIKTPYKLQLLCYICNPFFVYHILTRVKKYGLGATFFNSIILKYPALKVYENTCIQLASAQRPIKKMFEYISALHPYYKMYVLSNMNKQIFNNLYKEYPNHFSYFRIILYCGALTQWYQKPDYRTYQLLINMLKTHPENILFVDNTRVNVMNAQRLNMHVHQYRNVLTFQAFLKSFMSR